MLLSLALLLSLQDAPLPKADPLPPPGDEEAAVLAPINAMFAGMKARDGAAILAQVKQEGHLAAVTEAGVSHLGWAEFAGHMKPGPEQYVERLINPAIEIDGDIAMVWSPYVFTIDGKLSHCGTDHFDLVRENGAWKVLNITWTQRKTGCPGL